MSVVPATVKRSTEEIDAQELARPDQTETAAG
jgi:hypothetical protein